MRPLRWFSLGQRLTSILRILSVLFISLAIGSTGSRAQSASEPYIIGPEDVLSVVVLRHPEFSGEFLVPTGGLISFPAVGTVNVSGMSLTGLANVLKKSLTKRLNQPEVSVLLKAPRVRRIFVTGDVKISGAFDHKPGWRITEALVATGGLNPALQTSDVTVTIIRKDSGRTDSVPLADVLEGKPGANLPVNPGDVINFQSIDLIPVYVVGKVRLPGLFRLRKGDAKVLEAIAHAGGFLPEASTSLVTVTHVDGTVDHVDLTPSVISGETTISLTLRAGDLVTVPELQSRFAVLGLVKTPGFFPLPDGKVITLVDAITAANGADTRRARLSRVAMLRVENGQSIRKQYDVGKFLRRGDASQNPVVKSGDLIYVPETDSPDWNALFTSLSATSLLLSAVKK